MGSFECIHRKLAKCLYIYIGQTENCGLGIFAGRPFRAGETVMMDEDGDYYNTVLSYRELCRNGYTLHMTLQVGTDAFRLPTGNIDDFTNHSCDPNTGLRLTNKGMTVLALRDIVAHEELTYDYSTYLDNPFESFACHCGAANCRGIVGSFSTLPARLQQRYRALGIVGDFVDGPPVYAEAAD